MDCDFEAEPLRLLGGEFVAPGGLDGAARGKRERGLGLF